MTVVIGDFGKVIQRVWWGRFQLEWVEKIEAMNYQPLYVKGREIVL